MPTSSAPTITLDYRSQILACWQGKAIGGTLGMPLKGRDGPFDLTYYDSMPTVMLPNDGLDLQVLWACAIDAMETPAVDRTVLAETWRDHVNFPWDEYGVAMRNLRNALAPPASGAYDNWFMRGMGAAVRSELWACLAPGRPDSAAAYAREDACIDHAGEGIWACVFLAALQSLAFTQSDPDVMIDAAVKYLPESSELRRAALETRQWCAQSDPDDWKSVRQRILDHYERDPSTDVVMNVCFLLLGWLAGGGDLDRSLCIAVNCGKAADSTGAALGALLGILNPNCIGAKWLKPIGGKLVVSDRIVGLTPPATFEEFTDIVVDLRQQLGDQPPPPRPDEIVIPQRLELAVRFAFLDRMPSDGPAPDMPRGAMTRALPGAWARWDARRRTGPVLLVEYPFYLSGRQNVRILFDSRQPCRVWVDQAHAFTHDGGRMHPSFHHAPDGHWRDMNLAHGEHLLMAAIVFPPLADASSPQAPVEWVVGLADAQTHHWLPEALLKPKHRSPATRFNSRWRA